MSFKDYINTALWISTDDDDSYLDENYSIEDLSDDALRALEMLYDKFWDDNSELLERALDHASDDRIDHILWLTHNGHGVSFLDGDFPCELGTQLEKAASELPQITLYVGDDKKVYF